MIYKRPHSYDIVVHNRIVLRETWLLQCTWFMCVSCMRYGAHGVCVAHGLCYVMLFYVMRSVLQCTWFTRCAPSFVLRTCARSAALAQWQSGIHTCPGALRAVGPPPMPVRGQCGSPSALHRTPAVAMFSHSAPMHLCVTPCGKYTLVCDNMHALVCDTMRQLYSCVTPCTCVWHLCVQHCYSRPAFACHVCTQRAHALVCDTMRQVYLCVTPCKHLCATPCSKYTCV